MDLFFFPPTRKASVATKEPLGSSRSVTKSSYCSVSSRCIRKDSARRAKCQISTREYREKIYFHSIERGRDSILLNLFEHLTSAPSIFISGRRPKGSEPQTNFKLSRLKIVQAERNAKFI